MLWFVTPFRARSSTSDWPGVCRLLARTLRSVAAQTHGDYRMLLVGHDEPEGFALPPFCEFLRMDSAAPDRAAERDPARWLFACQTDRGRKLLRGVARVRENPDDYLMILDADDLVRRRVAAHVAAHPGANGWYVDWGYRLDDYPRPALYWRRRFYRECGSSYIFRAGIAIFPDRLDLSRDYMDYFIRRYEYHPGIRADFAGRGTPLAPLPFFGVIYSLNGRNVYAAEYRSPGSAWWNRLRRLKRRPVTAGLRREFGWAEEPDAAP